MRGPNMLKIRLSRLLPGLVALAALTFSLSLDAKPAPAAAAAAPPPNPNESCMMCHSDPAAKSASGKSIAVDAKAFAGSVHGQMQFKCTDCHSDVSAEKLPHEAKLKPANCAGCHEAAVKEYQSTAHAKARKGGNMVAATCTDCHGNHDIRKSSDPASRTHVAKIESTCGSCHGNDAVVQKAHLPGGNIVAKYHDSIHGAKTNGKGADAGKAPTCTGCHGAHKIRGKMDAESRVNRENVAQMCGSCHQQVYSRFSGSQHGTVRQAGNSAAPTCIDCHSAHADPVAHLGAVAGRRHQGVRQLPRRPADDVPRHIPRPGDATGLHARRDLLQLPRRARGAAGLQSEVDDLAGEPRQHLPQLSPGRERNFAAFKPHGNPRDREGEPILVLHAAVHGVAADRGVLLLRPAHHAVDAARAEGSARTAPRSLKGTRNV